MKNTQGPSLLSCFPSPSSPDCILTLLPQQPSAEDTHTHIRAQMHTGTHINTKPVAHTKQVFILSDVSALYVFAPVCVYIHVCVCAHWYFLSLAGYQPQTYLPLSFHLFLFLSLTVLLFPSIRCGP